jgi:Uma2 family endonuclease
MTDATSARLMTAEELLALPEDGMDRRLVRGELRERHTTARDRRHGRLEAKFTTALENWLQRCPGPRGEVVSGEAGFRLRRDPDTLVGIDVAYVSPEIVAISPNAVFFEGPSVLAVEVLSPSDSQEDIDEKVASTWNLAWRSFGWSIPGSGPLPCTGRASSPSSST